MYVAARLVITDITNTGARSHRVTCSWRAQADVETVSQLESRRKSRTPSVVALAERLAHPFR
jgi:hypothetical protein